MTIEAHKQLKLPNRADIQRAKRLRLLKSPYLVLGLLSYAFVTALIAFYLTRQPLFSSDMALVLPGSGSSNSFQIDDVGQAKSQTKSPFVGGSFNPRVNYKEIIKSREVINNAASTLKMTIERFGLPKIKLTEQSSILDVDVIATSPSLAKEKAWALYRAFQQHLDRLRADESLRRDTSIESVLDQYRIKLNHTRQALVEFQQRSLLVQQQQVGQLTSTLSDLRATLLYAKADMSQKKQHVNQLSIDLGVSPSLAGRAFSLQTDTQFRAHLKELDESAKQSSEYRSKWGANHPKVKLSQQRLVRAQDAAFDRSAALLGDVTGKMLHTLNLESSGERSRLFGDLVDTYAQLQGVEARINTLALSEQRLDDRLRVFARESKELERLQREHDLSQAVFTSASARLQASKADVFASYPIVQLLTVPSEALQQKSPQLKFAILGGILGYLFISISLIIVWQRAYLVSRLLKGY